MLRPLRPSYPIFVEQRLRCKFYTEQLITYKIRWGKLGQVGVFCMTNITFKIIDFMINYG